MSDTLTVDFLFAGAAAAHGITVDFKKDDTVVPFEQSKLMVDALNKAGKPVDFVILDGEDHWLSSGVTRLKMLQAVTAFLEKNDPPG